MFEFCKQPWSDISAWSDRAAAPCSQQENGLQSLKCYQQITDPTSITSIMLSPLLKGSFDFFQGSKNCFMAFWIRQSWCFPNTIKHKCRLQQEEVTRNQFNQRTSNFYIIVKSFRLDHLVSFETALPLLQVCAELFLWGLKSKTLHKLVPVAAGTVQSG